MGATSSPEPAIEAQVVPARPARQPASGTGARGATLGAATLVGLLVIWELVSLQVPPIIIPSPVAVAGAFWALSSSGKLWQAFGQMIVPLGEGLALAVVVGMAIGFAIGMNRWLARAVEPALYLFYSVPHVALLPLIIVWFGIGRVSEVFFIFISALFAVVVSTEGGVRDVDRSMIEVVRSLGATPREVVREVVIPATVPFALAGIRLAVVISVIAVIIAELFISASGIGYLLSYYGDTLQLAKYFAPLILVAALGVGLKQVVDWLDHTLIRWKPRAFGGPMT